jgi:hypothetical protein
MKKDSNLDFDGMAGDGVNRAGNRHAGNQSGLSMKENYGRGPVKGNIDKETSERGEGKSVTKDPMRRAPMTAGDKAGKINGGATVKGFGNPDKINVGSK